MTPARSLAASVIALGFASSLTAPTPAFAAPAPCEQAENYAAQSGAEMLRIDRLAWHTSPDLERPSIKSSKSSPDSSSGRSRGESQSVTDTAGGLLGSDADLTGGDFGDSGQGVTGFLSGTSDLLKSVTNGGVTAPGGPLNAVSGGQGGGGPVETSSRSKDASVSGVGLGETRTAMIADARTNAVAVGRIVDGQGPLGKPLVQSAPPNSADGSRRTPSGSAGPLGFGAGDLSTHAQWNPAMACGNAVGEAAHSSASVKHVDLLDLLHAPNPISSLSSTSLSRSGSEPRSVATATITAGRLNLADGRIKLQVLQPAKLTASMGTGSGGAVAYQPALVKVSWPGGKSKTLATAGDSVDISLGDPTESASLSALPQLDGLLPTSALPLPSVPGLPSLAMPQTESAPAAGKGVAVHISLGQVRRATEAHAVAAKVVAIEIGISEDCSESGHAKADKSDYAKGGKSGSAKSGSTKSGSTKSGSTKSGSTKPDSDKSGSTKPDSDKSGSTRSDSAKSYSAQSDSAKNDDQDGDTKGRGKDGYGDVSSSLVAQLGVGMLETAAVAPEAARSDSGAGAAAALPITGPQAGLLAFGGVGLLLAGGLTLLLGRRRRRSIS
jgi:LPXTG-motif cell wall-anchored protein